MPLYEAGITTAAPGTANQAYAALWNTGSSRIRLLEVGLTQVASGVVSKIYLKRISARGTQSTTLAGTPLDSNDLAAIGTVDSAWSVQPTLTGNPLHQLHIRSFDGQGVFYEWQATDAGIVIAGGAGIAIYNPQTLAVVGYEAYFAWRE